MPRKTEWSEIMEDWPKLRAGQMCRVRVAVIRKGKGIEVDLEFLDPEQIGRRISLMLPKPLRPTNLSGQFFAAAGQRVSIGEKIFPAQAVGKVVLARFAFADETQSWQIVEFAPMQKEETDHGRPE